MIKNILKTLPILALIALLPCTGNAAKVKGHDWRDPVVQIKGAIDFVSELSFALEVSNIIIEKQLTDDEDKDIKVVINSPGGYVYHGYNIIGMMRRAQYLGYSFTCVVENHAASMAAIIFAHCDSRYMIAGSKLLHHRPYIPEPHWSNMSYEEQANFEREVIVMLYVIADVIGMNPEKYIDLCDEDRFMSAREAKRRGFTQKITRSFHYLN